ncbi:mucin-19-like isoform X2 [Rhipicephalus sanguineus]|uniref:mucin-19-like isoform X2 n=1 Tax=Rhipicephalus sanguineus TaxID=34632 RepID=UPI0020C29D02|nr:mucin-19-like isoform X2 [Rhipicephalus sanguineus]
MKPKNNYASSTKIPSKSVILGELPIAFVSIASEPEIYLKSGQFADQGWSHGDDSGLDEAYLDARRTHEIIERRIGIISPPPLSSPDTFLPHLDSTRLLLTRPSKGRRSAGTNGAVAGGATTATTTYQWSNGGTAGAGPYQQHRVTTTTTTTTHRSTTTVEETSVRDQVHLLRLPVPPPKEERDPVEREGKPEESERQQQALDGQSEDRVHEEHTEGEADGPELSDAPPPAASVRRRPSVASSHPEVTGADAKDLASGVDDARSKDRSDEGDDDSSAQQRGQQREPSEASAAPSPASVRDRRSRSDAASTVTLTLPSPTSGGSQAHALGSQRRPSLTESRRRSVATVPIAESSRLSVPTYQQQPRKPSFAGGSLGPKRGDDDSGGQRLKSRAQSEEALSQDIEGESERQPRRRPSRDGDSRRSSTALSVDRGEAEQEAEAKPETGEAEPKAEAEAAQAARNDRSGGGGSSSTEDASSDQEARAGHVQASPSGAEVDRVASDTDRGREEQREQGARVEDGYNGREEAEPEGESRDYFHEEGPYRLEVTEEEENEEGALAQATSVAPVGKAGDVITAPSSQRTWKTTGGGDKASRRSKYPSSVGQPQLQKQQQKQQLSTRAPAATRAGASGKPAATGGVKAAQQSEMSVPEKVAGGRSRKQFRGKPSTVTVQVAKVRLIPGRPAAEAGTAEAEAEESEIKEYVRRGGERIRDGGGERDASWRASRKAVNNVDTARTVVESYRKSDAAAAAAAKKPKRERTFDVEVYVTELGETGTQTGGGTEASGKAVKERGSSSKGGGGGSGVRRRSRSHKSLSKSDTRGSLLGDKGHARGDKGTDTTDADASSLADSAGFGQEDPSMKDHGEAERERSEIESDRLDNERQITHTCKRR